jgi:hypothetical protein
MATHGRKKRMITMSSVTGFVYALGTRIFISAEKIVSVKLLDLCC